MPTNSDLHISLEWDAAQALNGAITDMSGRVYQSFTAPQGRQYDADFSLVDMPAGNYMLSIKGNNGGSAARMVTVVR